MDCMASNTGARFGDYAEFEKGEVSVDTLVRLLQKRHESPVMILCGVGEESEVEVRFYLQDGRQRVVRGPSIVSTLVVALEA